MSGRVALRTLEALIHGPLKERSQVVAVGVQGPSLVAREERGCRQLGFVGRDVTVKGSREGDGAGDHGRHGYLLGEVPSTGPPGGLRLSRHAGDRGWRRLPEKALRVVKGRQSPLDVALQFRPPVASSLGLPEVGLHVLEVPLGGVRIHGSSMTMRCDNSIGPPPGGDQGQLGLASRAKLLTPRRRALFLGQSARSAIPQPSVRVGCVVPFPLVRARQLGNRPCMPGRRWRQAPRPCWDQH